MTIETGNWTPERVIEALDQLDSTDPEAAHGDADALILALVPAEVVAARERLVERSGWWGCA